MHIRTNFLTLVGHSCWAVITNGLQAALQYPRKRTQPADEPAVVVAEPVPLESAVELSCRYYGGRGIGFRFRTRTIE